MADIPEDLIINILSKLPVKSLLRFKCVCKPWFSLINDQNFIKLHLDTAIGCNNLNLMICHSSLSTIEYDSPFDQAKDIDYPFKTPSYSAEILGSCNGLLCINPKENVYCLWNPSTKEYKLIPEAPGDVEFHFVGDWRTIHTICFGLGYDHSDDDYKVVKIDNLNDECSMHVFNFDVKVYSARTNSWKSVEVVPCYILYEKQSGVFVNGALHWAVTRICNNEDYLTSVIVVYNLAQEVFKEMSLPDFENYEFQFCVGELGGSLCLFCHVSPIKFDVWVMKDYGVEQSWRNHFSISLESEPFEYLRPLCYCGDGYKVLADKDGNILVVYDLITGDAKTTRIHDIPYWLDTMMYVGSLVSLNSGCYVRQEEAITTTQQLLCEHTWDDEVWVYWDGMHLMQ